ncbi:MAG TPA: penicillin acylase family protein, partial [Candidatus Hydrogenedentes bacterium]|nr:penicillin acylase family protein [Candidatus Hydrogenedentota bacterium]
AWKMMEALERPIVVKRDDGSYEVRPCTVYRTVHGPVVHRMPYNHQAYVRSIAHDRQQVASMAAFLGLNFAQNVHDFEEPIRDIATSQNFIAADVDGNIGYWLSGRLPKRHPKQDPRLPTTGTGEYDWQGITVATDLVRSVNPPEGWFGCFNNKPSVNTPGWWPEFLWGHPIHAILQAHDPIDWDTFVGINRENGEHHFAGPFFQDYLVRVLRAHAGEDPRVDRAAEILEAWPSKDLPGATGALLLSEWAMETMTELLRPDFGPLVQRNLSRENLQVFGILAFRVLRPDLAGMKVTDDYLHGRDGEALAYVCFRRVIDALAIRYGDDMAQWPYEPEPLKLGDLTAFPNRNCGTYWMAVELKPPMRSLHMLVPGQSERRASSHFQDQYPLFSAWRMREMPFGPEAFTPLRGDPPQ